MTDDRITHWDNRYAGSAPEGLSWFETSPDLSLSLIRGAVGMDAAVVDIYIGMGTTEPALPDVPFRGATGLVDQRWQTALVADRCPAPEAVVF